MLTRNKKGKVLIKYFLPNNPIKQDVDKVLEKIIEIEQELNGRISTEIYKKYGIAIRFHL